MNELQRDRFKFSEEQITSILDKIVPLIAVSEDQGFFRGVLRLRFEQMGSSSVAAFVSRLLSFSSLALDLTEEQKQKFIESSSSPRDLLLSWGREDLLKRLPTTVEVT